MIKENESSGIQIKGKLRENLEKCVTGGMICVAHPTLEMSYCRCQFKTSLSIAAVHIFMKNYRNVSKIVKSKWWLSIRQGACTASKDQPGRLGKRINGGRKK